MINKKLLKWRRRQKRGAIMSPETFHKIESSERAKGLSENRAERAAGSQYWRIAKAKYRKSLAGKKVA